jgi:hypothetical protein
MPYCAIVVPLNYMAVLALWRDCRKSEGSFLGFELEGIFDATNPGYVSKEGQSALFFQVKEPYQDQYQDGRIAEVFVTEMEPATVYSTLATLGLDHLREQRVQLADLMLTGKRRKQAA